MHPLTAAIHKAVGQFTDNHQSLSMLMVNTLVAIIEGEVGPLLKAEHDLRVAEVGAIEHMLCRRLGGTVEGQPTAPINYLQRVDELRAGEGSRDAIRDTIDQIKKLVVDSQEAAAKALRVAAEILKQRDYLLGELRIIKRISPDFDGEDEDGQRQELSECLATAQKVAGRAIHYAEKHEGSAVALEPAASKSKEYHCHECGVEFGLRHEDGCNQATVSPGRCVECEAGVGMPHREGCKLAGVVL